MAFHPDLTDEQRSNLTKLAAYLRKLPAGYRDFDMSDYADDYFVGPHIISCGTSACAVGHAPSAGIEPVLGEDWWSYSLRALCSETERAWQWCFNGSWGDVDNTACGAAARIEHMLVRGVPDDSFDQMYGDAPLSYSVEAA